MSPELPILGEPLIPEFANTLYRDEHAQFEVFDHPTWAAAWMVSAPCASERAAPRRLRMNDMVQLRSLRDAIRLVLLRDRVRDQAGAVAVINEAARLATPRRELVLVGRGELAVKAESSASRLEAFLALIAWQVFDATENGDLKLITLCSRPGCNMFYFRNHHRRRFCNQRCANTDRQARYNRRLNERSDGHLDASGLRS